METVLICAIQGKILEKEPAYVDIMTAGGVGYRVHISVNTFAKLGKEEAFLKISPIYREDAQLLFGFHDENELKMFEMLLKVTGVGAKSALAICSTFTPATFAQILETQDLTALTKVPGIGKKSGGLILVQLSGFSSELAGGGAAKESPAAYEATLALESLGFRKEAIMKVLKTCAATETGALVKEALQKFQK